MISISIPLSHYLIFSAIVFSISICGIIMNRSNLLILLMSIELMLLSVNTNFLIFSSMLQQTVGNIFVFFILTVTAAESIIGLAIIIVLFRGYKSVDISKLNILKG